ncbi:hypothetical protein GDO78_022558 [Eleutherodactylus coqui]|uniref:Uncharacterized protein n=1 Tax=Eleutherodactylus coqui TaxID=57060 RepID=A0A8J6EMC3_ELECQ|nr:hypothetical protein GDO78_022558 [Eleutherodactylus coqui]
MHHTLHMCKESSTCISLHTHTYKTYLCITPQTSHTQRYKHLPTDTKMFLRPHESHSFKCTSNWHVQRYAETLPTPTSYCIPTNVSTYTYCTYTLLIPHMLKYTKKHLLICTHILHLNTHLLISWTYKPARTYIGIYYSLGHTNLLVNIYRYILLSWTYKPARTCRGIYYSPGHTNLLLHI